MAYATAPELQSGLDRQKWAENLILQLPESHDGRNSWLLNYGRGAVAQGLRKERDLPFYEASLAALPAAEAERKYCARYQKCEEGTAECHCLAVADCPQASEVPHE
jgi:hypothetical protein